MSQDQQVIYQITMTVPDGKNKANVKLYTDEKIAKDSPLFLYRLLLKSAKTIEGPALFQLRQEQMEKSKKIEVVPGNAHIDRSTKS